MLIDCILAFEAFCSSRELPDSSFVFKTECVKFVWVNALLIINTSIKLSHSNQFCSFLDEEFGGPISYITETLNDEGFS